MRSWQAGKFGRQAGKQAHLGIRRWVVHRRATLASARGVDVGAVRVVGPDAHHAEANVRGPSRPWRVALVVGNFLACMHAHGTDRPIGGCTGAARLRGCRENLWPVRTRYASPAVGVWELACMGASKLIVRMHKMHILLGVGKLHACVRTAWAAGTAPPPPPPPAAASPTCLSIPVQPLPGLDAPEHTFPGLNAPVQPLPGLDAPVQRLPGLNAPVHPLPALSSLYRPHLS